MRLLVESDPQRVRIALLEGDRLAELHVDGHAPSRVGDIYLGRVRRLVPGIDAAFIDIGLERNAFLQSPDAGPDTEPLAEHEAVIVQVFRDEVPGKGARVRRGASLPGRHLVLLSQRVEIHVSTRITDEDERQRLVAAVTAAGLDDVGWIVRTAAVGAGAAELAAEARELREQWEQITRQAAGATPPRRLHCDLDPVQRWLRDRATTDIREIWVDSPRLEETIVAALAELAPELVSRVRRHEGTATLFEHFSLAPQLADLWRRRVPLPSGGSLVIEPTEALVAVDVNSGRDVAGASLEATALATNLEAAVETARQIRLRDLAGILVIDFIDMAESASWDRVLATLVDELARDRAATLVEGPLAFGLVALTRKRGRNDLLRRLSVECPECAGAGRLPSPAEVLGEARRTLFAREALRPGRSWRLRLPPAAARSLDADGGAARRELQARISGSLLIEVATELGPSRFELIEETA